MNIYKKLRGLIFISGAPWFHTRSKMGWPLKPKNWPQLVRLTTKKKGNRN